MIRSQLSTDRPFHPIINLQPLSTLIIARSIHRRKPDRKAMQTNQTSGRSPLQTRRLKSRARVANPNPHRTTHNALHFPANLQPHPLIKLLHREFCLAIAERIISDKIAIKKSIRVGPGMWPTCNCNPPVVRSTRLAAHRNKLAARGGRG